MSENRIKYRVLFAVIALTAAVHAGCLFLDFNSFWDHIHVYQNPFQAPLSPGLVGRAFREVVEAEYTPLRSLSNSLDYTIWGDAAFGHHLTGFLIFLLNVALVFLLIDRLMAAAGGASSRRISVAGLTALFFGIHPLKVQVVAWVTPRDYQLGACFYLLCILAYIAWSRSRSGRLYALALLLALCASLSQAMAVSLPLVLLLLDYYPLARAEEKSAGALLLEKVPFLLIAFATCCVTWMIRRDVGTLHTLSLSTLVLNGIEFPASLFFYAYKTLFPLYLAPIYPIGATAGAGLIAVSWIMLGALIALAVARRKTMPALLAGTLISLVMLLPAGGLVRSGATVLADRYVQLANLPLLLLVAWSLVEALRRPRLRWFAACTAAAWAIFLIWKTVTYTPLWADAVGLTRLAYDRHPGSGIIELFMLRTYNNAAAAQAEGGRFDEAVDLCRKAIEINPAYPDTYTNMGALYIGMGKEEEGMSFFAKAAALAPGDPDAHFNLGLAYRRMGKKSEARAAFEKALLLNPSHARAHQQLAKLK